MDQPERLAYRVTEAAEAIGVSRAKAYQLIADGTIPSIRIGSSIRVPVGALRQWVGTRLEQRSAGESR